MKTYFELNVAGDRPLYDSILVNGDFYIVKRHSTTKKLNTVPTTIIQRALLIYPLPSLYNFFTHSDHYNLKTSPKNTNNMDLHNIYNMKLHHITKKAPQNTTMTQNLPH